MRFQLLLAFLVLVINGSAQTVVKAYAFSEPMVVGNAPAQDAGKVQEQYRYVVYLTLNAKETIKISRAWIGQSNYEVQINALKDKKVSLGRDMADKDIKIKAFDRHQFIKLTFSTADLPKKIPASYKNQKAGTILLEIKNKNKTSYYLIKTIIPLKPDRSIG